MAEKTPVEQLTYKQASQELELIIRSLESGDMELEESLESYTRGVELLKSLRTRLSDAEQKVSVLLKDVDGNDVLADGRSRQHGRQPLVLTIPTKYNYLGLWRKEPTMCDCIFCKIANHEIPSTVVYEDDQVIAFDDLNPQAPVHTLVIPKKHYSDIADNVPAETMGAMAHAIQEVAKAKGLEDGFRVISNKGVNAGQTVMHFHMHVLGGKNLGENLI